MKAIRTDSTPQHLHLDLGAPRPVLGSCVLGGGFGLVRHIVNLRVDANLSGENAGFPDPVLTLRDYSRVQGWRGPVAGMMTAASMRSMRSACMEDNGLKVLAWVTSGLSNARCAGDRAECRDLPGTAPAPGTINIIMAASVRFTPAAMVEAIMTIAEAKAAVLRGLDIRSRISDRVATGTGTDAVAVVSGNGPEALYCGKHVLIGELVAQAVMDALSASLAWYEKEGPWA